MLSEDDQPASSLRERKKAKTRIAIQEHALRLIQEQGYDETTVEQIAAAAEVSPSTFFRYFPTKEDVVMYDIFDPDIIEAFRAQPAALSPIQAFREAMREVFGGLPAEELALQQERAALMRSVPELRGKMLDDFARSFDVSVELLAERLGRPKDDFAVHNAVGVVMGVAMAAWFAAEHDPQADYFALVDRGLAHLEAGLPL